MAIINLLLSVAINYIKERIRFLVNTIIFKILNDIETLKDIAAKLCNIATPAALIIFVATHIAFKKVYTYTLINKHNYRYNEEFDIF